MSRFSKRCFGALCVACIAIGISLAAAVKGPCSTSYTCSFKCTSTGTPGEWWASSDTTTTPLCDGQTAPTCNPVVNKVNCSVTYYNNVNCASKLPNGNTGILRTDTLPVDTCK
jgi:hypothetical protein